MCMRVCVSSCLCVCAGYSQVKRNICDIKFAIKLNFICTFIQNTRTTDEKYAMGRGMERRAAKKAKNSSAKAELEGSRGVDVGDCI